MFVSTSNVQYELLLDNVYCRSFDVDFSMLTIVLLVLYSLLILFTVQLLISVYCYTNVNDYYLRTVWVELASKQQAQVTEDLHAKAQQ